MRAAPVCAEGAWLIGGGGLTTEKRERACKHKHTHTLHGPLMYTHMHTHSHMHTVHGPLETVIGAGTKLREFTQHSNYLGFVHKLCMGIPSFGPYH